jgi:6-phosphofructokinase 1
LYGARFGLPGIFNQDFVDLLAQPETVMQRIGRAPASALGSSRYEVSEQDLRSVLRVFRTLGVRYFLYTGGNGSMGTAMQLSDLAKRENFPLQIVGIPKTIDNDLFHTDHTPGYASAARFFANAVRDIGADNKALPNQVEVIEVLGRNAGWIAAATSLAKAETDDAPHLIYLPENRLHSEKFLDDVSAVYRRLNRCVVVVCEGQLDEDGQPFGADVRFGSRGSLAQNLGHRLALLVSSRLNLRARSEKPGLLGRAAGAYISPVDWEEAQLCGRHAVHAIVKGASDVMITLARDAGPQYSVHPGEVPLTEVAFKERLFPSEWMDLEHAGVSNAFQDYATPLVGIVEPHARLARVPLSTGPLP